MLNASKEIVDFSKMGPGHKLPGRWKLTRAKLCLKTGKFCHLLGKGWHCMVVLKFLLYIMDQPRCAAVDARIKSLLWAADHLVGHLAACRKDKGLLLEENDITQTLQLSRFFHHVYLDLHVAYRNFPGFKLWNVRPKWHAFQHWAESAQSGRNPMVNSCFMDEDWLKTIMAISRKTHAKTVQRSTLQRFLAGQHRALVDP